MLHLIQLKSTNHYLKVLTPNYFAKSNIFTDNANYAINEGTIPRISHNSSLPIKRDVSKSLPGSKLSRLKFIFQRSNEDRIVMTNPPCLSLL